MPVHRGIVPSAAQLYAIRLIEKYSGRKLEGTVTAGRAGSFILKNYAEYENAKAVEELKREAKKDAEKTEETSGGWYCA